MARTPLAPTSANIRRRSKELSPATRGKIIGRADAGQWAPQITRATKLPRSTVRDTLSKAPIRPHQHSLPRSGRLEAYSDNQIPRTVESQPSITYQELKNDLQLSCSIGTLQRIVAKHHI